MSKGEDRPEFWKLEFAVRVVRYLLRVSMFVLVGGAAFCGLVLLFNAQALLNRYAERYMMNRANAAHHQPVLPSTTAEPLNAGRSAAPEQQASQPAPVAERERAVAIYVRGAESIADVAAADRWVDVILTHQPGTGAPFSEVVLENVKVLTIELVTADGGGGGQSALHAVTLDVDSDVMENLALASRSSEVSLALHRRRGDDRPSSRQRGGAEAAALPPIAARDTTGGSEVAEGVPPSAPEAGQANVPEVASNAPTAAPDDDRFAIVTIHRVRGKSSTYRVPRER